MQMATSSPYEELVNDSRDERTCGGGGADWVCLRNHHAHTRTLLPAHTHVCT